MPLKKQVATLDEVPEALRSAYIERDGKFVLDLDGDGGDEAVKLKKALETERRERETAQKTLNELKRTLGDLDPAKAREALATLQDIEEKTLLGELPPNLKSAVDQIVAKRIERQSTEFRTREEALAADLKKRDSQLDELLIDNAIRAAAARARVRSTAVEDAVLYGKTVWKRNKDGVPVPLDAKGEVIYSKKDSTKPADMDEWLADRAADRAHWFEGSTGTGAASTGAGTGGRAHTITREQAKDFGAYKAAKAQAEKAGVELQVVEA